MAGLDLPVSKSGKRPVLESIKILGPIAIQKSKIGVVKECVAKVLRKET